MNNYANSRWKERGSFSKETSHSYQDIVDAIRTAPYGIDVRAAIIEFLSLINGKIPEDDNQKDFSDLIDKLEKNSATHEEVVQVKKDMNDKIESIILGTNMETVSEAVEIILKEKGVIN